MDSFPKYYKKRARHTFGFILPIILACVVLGLAVNIMKHQGASQSARDLVFTLGILLIFLFLLIGMFARQPLPGILGKWQKHFRSIPTGQDLKE